MCTVSIVPTVNGFILTSSRDEQKSRPTRAPQYYKHGSRRLWYPKDMQSGGTWLAFEDTTCRIACLLNGAFDAHKRKEKYRKSRGQVLIEQFDFEDPYVFYDSVDLQEIEPFTLIMIDTPSKKVHELRWDGVQKYFSALGMSQSRIWSSATLYNAREREEREQWFWEWIRRNEPERILEFHQGRHGKDPAIDINMMRLGGLQTVSISQICINNNKATFFYQELL